MIALSKGDNIRIDSSTSLAPVGTLGTVIDGPYWNGDYYVRDDLPGSGEAYFCLPNEMESVNDRSGPQ